LTTDTVHYVKEAHKTAAEVRGCRTLRRRRHWSPRLRLLLLLLLLLLIGVFSGNVVVVACAVAVDC